MPDSSLPPIGIGVSSSPSAMRFAIDAAAESGRTMPRARRSVIEAESSMTSSAPAMLMCRNDSIAMTDLRRSMKLWSAISSINTSNCFTISSATVSSSTSTRSEEGRWRSVSQRETSW